MRNWFKVNNKETKEILGQNSDDFTFNLEHIAHIDFFFCFDCSFCAYIFFLFSITILDAPTGISVDFACSYV